VNTLQGCTTKPITMTGIFTSVISEMDFIDYEKGPWVAGGAAMKISQHLERGNSDIDIFFANEDQYKATMKWFTDAYHTLYDEVITKAFHQFKVRGVRIQLITSNYFESLNELFDDFDFSVCRFATDGVSVLGRDEAWLDCERKVLRLLGPARKSMFRLAKYCRSGFTPEAGTLGKIVDGLQEKHVGANFMIELDQDAY
jgi:hypothetical protein